MSQKEFLIRGRRLVKNDQESKTRPQVCSPLPNSVILELKSRNISNKMISKQPKWERSLSSREGGGGPTNPHVSGSWGGWMRLCVQWALCNSGFPQEIAGSSQTIQEYSGWQQLWGPPEAHRGSTWPGPPLYQPLGHQGRSRPSGEKGLWGIKKNSREVRINVQLKRRNAKNSNRPKTRDLRL